MEIFRRPSASHGHQNKRLRLARSRGALWAEWFKVKLFTCQPLAARQTAVDRTSGSFGETPDDPFSYALVNGTTSGKLHRLGTALLRQNGAFYASQSCGNFARSINLHHAKRANLFLRDWMDPRV